MPDITIEQQQKIDASVNNIQQQVLADYDAPVNLEELAEKYGIEIIEADLKEVRKGLKGMLTYEDPEKQTKPQIYLDHSMNSERRRFTIAHELGHHFLHKGVKLRLDNFDYTKDNEEAREEIEANRFAVSLLMPKEVMLRMMQKGKSISSIARYFGVSKAAANNRVGKLLAEGYLNDY